MNKGVKYAANGAVIIGLGNAAINAFKQLNNLNSDQKFDWIKFLKAFGNGAVVGVTGGFAIGLIRDNKMSNHFILSTFVFENSANVDYFHNLVISLSFSCLSSSSILTIRHHSPVPLLFSLFLA